MNTFQRVNEKIGHYRWVICALLFFATTLNYLDRAVIGLLKEELTEIFHWTESDYSNIVICFQIAYAVSLLCAGWIIDKIGTKIGYAISIVIWSVAAMLHGLATGTWGFAAARAMLGMGESGNFPAANKTVSEWFPRKERAFATGLYNSGANIGAIVAPLLVPWIALHWGWQWAFIMTGAVGLFWLIFWFIFYTKPSDAKRLSPAELAYINSDAAEEEPEVTSEEKKSEETTSVSWLRLLTHRQTWAFFFGKFLTDPVWWFFLFWLPAFLQSEYGLSGMEISFPLIVVYTISSLGSIFGGWLPKHFINRGQNASSARKVAMLIYAIVPLSVLFVQQAGSYNMWYAIILISLACAAHCAWSANIFATVSDMFPKRAVASVTGIGGMAGSVGGILIAWAAGLLFDHYKMLGDIGTGYGIMFIICALAYLLAWMIMMVLAPGFRKVKNL